MNILARLLALFLIMPAVELALLFVVGEYIGFFPTIGLIIFTGVVGGYLAKREGLSAWNRLKGRLDSGGLPGKELLDGVVILLAGALLITPGVLTDLIGFLGLLPPTRALIRKQTMKRIKKAMRDGTIQTSFGGYGEASRSPEEDGGFGYGAFDEARYEEAQYEDLSGQAASDEDRPESSSAARSPFAPPLPERSASESSASESSAPKNGASEGEHEGQPPRTRSGREARREVEEFGEPHARGQQRGPGEGE